MDEQRQWCVSPSRLWFAIVCMYLGHHSLNLSRDPFVVIGQLCKYRQSVKLSLC